jgi:Flp pilus assembly protein TadD
MDSSIKNSHLFGDAKATAAVGGPQRKRQALDAAEMRMQAEPSVETFRAYGAALFELGMFSEAERVFNTSITKFGEDLQVLVDLAFTYKNLNRIEDAKSTFLKAVAKEPKSSLARCAENEVWTLDPSYQPSWIRKSPSAV